MEGHYNITGAIWHDKFGRYEIKFCPTSDDPCEVIEIPDSGETDNWITVWEGNNVVTDNILGYLDTFNYITGDYYMRVFVYDDLNRLINPISDGTDPNAWEKGCVRKELYYNGQNHDNAIAEYPVSGKTEINKSFHNKSFHYEEKPDVSLNWAGSFPFEFRRIYDSKLRKQLYPLFFGWTHNHNIRVLESTKSGFETDQQGLPKADAQGLGIGKLYLLMPVGGRKFEGFVDENDPNIVVYLPDDNKNDYIERVSNVYPATEQFDVTYTYYGAEGGKYEFTKEENPLSYSPPSGEGVVDWKVYTGIDRRQDRFGNALVYEWDSNDIFINTIESEVNGTLTGKKIILTRGELDGWNGSPELYNKISVSDGTVVTDCYEMSVEFVSAGSSRLSSMFCSGWIEEHFDNNEKLYAMYKLIDVSIDNNTSEIAELKYRHRKFGDRGFIIDQDPHYMKDPHYAVGPVFYPYGDGDRRVSYLGYDNTGSLKIKLFSVPDIDASSLKATGSRYFEIYSNSYDSDGNLVSDVDYYTGGSQYWYKYKTNKTTYNKKGAILRNEYRTYDCVDIFNNDHRRENLYLYGVSAAMMGGGGFCDKEYLYKDPNFPRKPTTVFEYFDDDGNGDYDRQPRKTKKAYNATGNLIQKKIYKDPNHLVLTEYEYHPLYDFKVSKTTWQDYCTEDANGIIYPAESERVEKHWIYGDSDGTINPNGKYLVQEKTLLDASTDVNEWAVTNYTYHPNGKLKTKENPRTPGQGEYRIYNNEGLVTNIFKGVDITGGVPTVLPQKRYAYDDLGRVKIEGNYLGEVKLYTYDNIPGNITSIKTFDDVNAMAGDFLVSSYCSDCNDFISLQLFKRYDHRNNPTTKQIPGGGIIVQSPWWNNNFNVFEFGDYCEYLSPDDGSSDGHILKYPYPYPYPDGQISSIERDWTNFYWDSDTEPTGELWGIGDEGIYTHYDSMNRKARVLSESKTNKQAQSIIEYSCSDYIYRLENYKYYGSGKVRNKKQYNITAEYVGTKTWEVYLESNTDYYYDSLDRLIKKVEDPNDPQLGCHISERIKFLSSDAEHTNLTDPNNDPNDNFGRNIVEKYGYDALGNKIYKVDPNENIIFSDFDQANRKICEYYPKPVVYYQDSSEIDIDSSKIGIKKYKEVEYYEDDKVESITVYDTDGQTTLKHTEFTYDSRGRIESVSRDIAPGQDPAVTTYDYWDAAAAYTGWDGGEYHIRVNDADGQKTLIAFDIDKSMKRILYPSGRYEDTEDYLEYYRDNIYDEWEVGLNETHKTTGIVGGASQTIIYERGPYGEIQKAVYPGGGYINFEYFMTPYEDKRKIWKIHDFRTPAYKPGSPNDAFQYEYRYDYRNHNVRRFSVSVCDINQFDSGRMFYEVNDIPEYIVDYNNLASHSDKPTEIRVIDTNSTYEQEDDFMFYKAGYEYDMLGRVTKVSDLLRDANIASFEYDDRGNRKLLTYYTDESDAPDANVFQLDYDYDINNNIKEIFIPQNSDILLYRARYDGLGRLDTASETVSYPDDSEIFRSIQQDYDMQGQLITYEEYINSSEVTDYYYSKDGNIEQKDTGGLSDYYEYDTTAGGDVFDSDIMTKAGGNNLVWDANGRLIQTADKSFSYNHRGKLSSCIFGANSVNLKYDGFGNRFSRQAVIDGNTVNRRYIVNPSGLANVLCEFDPNAPNSLRKVYYYTPAGQILCQYDCNGIVDANVNVQERYYYIHDRLGSVRMVIDSNSDIANSYTYDPFGQFAAGQCEETVYNPFKFTGQWYDEQTGQYYLRARQYAPQLMRFTSRDPVRGKFAKPLTLNPYLYCKNDPVNRIDPSGELSAAAIVSPVLTGAALYSHGLNLATYGASSGDFRFFDLAEATFDFMPVGMAISVGGGSIAGRAAGFGMGLITEEATQHQWTGMGFFEGSGMDYWAYMAYGSYMSYHRTKLNDPDLFFEEMQEFHEWRGDW